jgi:threonine dehydrogenase-like Zn-dependent dehydrogenase
MRALVFRNGKLQFLRKYPVPHPGNNEALIRIRTAGICNTDIEITKGYLGFRGIPGHEFAGVVEKCMERGLIGKRVVGEINISCRRCSFCRHKMHNHCVKRSVLGILKRNGVFSEYITLPVKNLHILPSSISDEEGVFVEPLASAFEIINQLDIDPLHKVCVMGDGKLGLLVAQAVKLSGCQVTVVGKHRNKLSILEKRNIKTRLRSEFRGNYYDFVIDCTGSPSGLNEAIKVVKPLGTVVIKTTTAKPRPLDINAIVINEISLVGSRCGPFPRAIKALQDGSIHVRPLISRIFPLEKGITAMRYASGKGVLKVIFKLD